MRKLNIGLIAVLVIMIGLNIFQFIFWKNANAASTSIYTQAISDLEQQVSSFGSEVTVYTVLDAVKAGDRITEDNLTPMKMYSSLVTDQFITDIDSIVGRYHKIALNPGTPILANMVMDEELIDSARDRDIFLDRLTVGIEDGDYIDVRMTMPYGDDYVVLSHKRIEQINEGTIKLYLSEYEWNIYQGALIDYFLNKEYGVTLYGDRYIEPGLQQKAQTFYAVPTNIAALLQKNPNIVDLDEASSMNEWRSSIEEILVLFRTDEDTIEADAGRLAAGRVTMNDSVESDRATVQAEKEAAEAEAAEAEDEYIGDDFWDEDISDSPADDGTVDGTE